MKLFKFENITLDEFLLKKEFLFVEDSRSSTFKVLLDLFCDALLRTTPIILLKKDD